MPFEEFVDRLPAHSHAALVYNHAFSEQSPCHAFKGLVKIGSWRNPLIDTFLLDMWPMVVHTLEWPWLRDDSVDCLAFLTSFKVKLNDGSHVVNLVQTIAIPNMLGFDTGQPLSMLELLMEHCRVVLMHDKQF